MPKSKSLIIPEERIMSKIYLMRGQKVILDKDIADLYGVKPIRLREQVKRNKERFPNDFMFQLTKQETELMVSHFAIPSKRSLGGYLPYAFTQEGAAMLSTVLKSKRAMEVSVGIMRVFVKLREIIMTNKQLREKIEKMEKTYNKQFQIVFTAIKQLAVVQDDDENQKQEIGFKP